VGGVRPRGVGRPEEAFMRGTAIPCHVATSKLGPCPPSFPEENVTAVALSFAAPANPE
jgi:hypothetical protein